MSHKTINGIFYDGDFSVAIPTGPVVWEQPFATDNNRYIYRQPFMQLIDCYRPLAYDTAGPAGGFLVNESTPSPMGGGLCTFERVFATLPRPRSEPEMFSFTYQDVVNSNTINTTLTITSRVHYEYFRALNPQTIPILRGWRLKLTGNGLYIMGDKTTDLPEDSDNPTERVGEDSIVSHWMGNFYERKTRYVPYRHLVQVPV